VVSEDTDFGELLAQQTDGGAVIRAASNV